jgi:hypothetical protein
MEVKADHQHDAGEHPARADSVPEDAAGNLKRGVRECEDPADPAPGDWANVERVLNARTGDGDAHAIEIGNDDEQGHQPQHAIAVFHRLSPADLALQYQPMQGTVYQSNSRGVRPGPCWQGSSAS